MTHAIAAYFKLGRILWMVAGALLFVVGFAVDGSTEIGHHAALIAGGIAVGAGLFRS
jgi:hypothetical protein